MNPDRLSAITAAITKVIAAVTSLILAVMGAVSIIAGNPAGVTTDTTQVTTTTTVPAAPPAIAVDTDGDGKRDEALPLDADAQEQVEDLAQSNRGDAAAGDLRGKDNTEAGVTQGPLAAPEFPGCRDAFVRNFSQRTAAVRYITWHETVSRENGLSSQNALTARANTPSTQVSWHFLVGRSNGLCTYTVPINLKAWHVGNGNSVSVGIEVEADGSEPSYVEGAGKAKLFAITKRVAAIYHIPIQHGVIRFDGNCNPIIVKPGILEHRDYGLCGGGHLDVCSSALCRSGGPESAENPAWQIDPLIRELAAQAKPLSADDRHRCNALHYHREKIRAGAKYRDRLTVNGRPRSRGHRMRYLRTVLERHGVDQKHLCNK